MFAGCVLQPEWLRLVKETDLERLHLSTAEFEHVVLLAPDSGAPLYLYIEGDGTPWVREQRVAIDPTPSNPVLLRLLSTSSQSAAYLGRPCYFGTSTSRGCAPRYWTFERYGADVVGSMCDAANQVIRRTEAGSVVLVGYSGGAAIAAAMRGCVNKLVGVISLAGNLDPEAWASLHDYSPLSDLPELAKPDTWEGYEVHWQCTSDENVPPAVTDRYFEHNPNAERRLVDNCSHASGWETYWPQIIR